MKWWLTLIIIGLSVSVAGGLVYLDKMEMINLFPDTLEGVTRFQLIQLFFEDWEAGNFDDWDNTDWSIETSPAIDTNSAGCLQRNTCDMSSIVSADTSSVGTVNVSFSYYDIGCVVGEAIWYWNNTDGNWISMGNIDGGTLSGYDAWYLHSVQSADSQYKHTGFAIRFLASPGNKDFYYIDNINISYTEAPADSCTCAGDGNNWEINLADFCVINDNCDLGIGNITFVGEGNITFNALITALSIGDLPANQRGYITNIGEVYTG